MRFRGRLSPERLERFVPCFPRNPDRLRFLPNGFSLEPFYLVPQHLGPTVFVRRCPRHLKEGGKRRTGTLTTTIHIHIFQGGDQRVYSASTRLP